MRKTECEDVDYLVCLFSQEMDECTQSEREIGRKGTEVGKKLYFFIPETFIETSKEETVFGYLFEDYPERIYRDAMGRCDLMFQSIEKQPQNLTEALETAKSTLRINDKEIIFYDSGSIKEERSEVGWFEYKSFVESEVVYNMVFMVDAEEQRIFGAFHCFFEEYGKWKPVVNGMLENIKIGEENADERILD